MNEWLQSFAYKIVLSRELDVFIYSALIAFLITMLTVAYHTRRAATANPVEALRDE